MITVSTEVSFEAAHHLPKMPDGHKCKRLHGHNWRVVITCAGPVDDRGMVVDYYEIEQAWKPLFDILDHRLLNEIPGLENPTTEVLAAWIFNKLLVAGERNGKPIYSALPLHSLDVYETPHMHCRIDAT